MRSVHVEFRKRKANKHGKDVPAEDRKKPHKFTRHKKATKNANHATPYHSLYVFYISSKL